MLRTDSQALKVVEDFFAYQGFNGREKFRINSGMIFVKTLGVKLQHRDPDGGNYTQVDEYHKPPLEMDEDTIDEEFPLISQDVLMFCGKMKSRPTIFKHGKALIIPSYQSPLFRLLPIDQAKYLRNEFFFYPKSLNDEFIVYRLNRTDMGAIEYAFYRPNGKYESSVRLKIHGVKDYTNVNLSVSPNGKYVFYVEENEDYNEEEALAASKLRNTRHTIKTTKLVGRVSEIVTLRPKKDRLKLANLVKKFKNFKGKKFTERLGESINIKDVTFSLRPVRSIPDIGSTFSLYDDPHKDENEESTRLYVTDTGNVIFLDKISKLIFFNEIDMYKN